MNTRIPSIGTVVSVYLWSDILFVRFKRSTLVEVWQEELEKDELCDKRQWNLLRRKSQEQVTIPAVDLFFKVGTKILLHIYHISTAFLPQIHRIILPCLYQNFSWNHKYALHWKNHSFVYHVHETNRYPVVGRRRMTCSYRQITRSSESNIKLLPSTASWYEPRLTPGNSTAQPGDLINWFSEQGSINYLIRLKHYINYLSQNQSII